MSYNYKKAINKILDYLHLKKNDIEIIDNTNERGFVCKVNDEQIVIFVYPISCKQNARQSFFDTRDSGVKERKTTWSFAKEHGLKYFCLAVNDEQTKYKDYVLSLESDEESISAISFRTSSSADSVTGTQVNIPNAFIPKQDIERIKTPKGFYITAVHKDHIVDYISFFDNRPYMHKKMEKQLDEYERAAKYAEKYVQKKHINVYREIDEYTKYRDEFREKYGPEKLKALKDEELLEKMFYTAAQTNDSLCYWLERKDSKAGEKDKKSLWGSIFGGSVYKFKVNQNVDTKQWYVDDNEANKNTALKKAKEIRELLVNGARIIENADLNTVADYINLDNKLEKLLGKYHKINWIHKYFSVLYPKKLSSFHKEEWQKHILNCFLIKPEDGYYVRSGQISLIERHCEWQYPNLIEMCTRRYGEKYISFYHLKTVIEKKDYFDKMRKNHYIGIGWTNDLGDLSKGEKTETVEKIRKMLPTTDKEYAGQIKNYYEIDSNAVVVFCKNEECIALADELGDYYYVEKEKDGHRKHAKFHNCFDGEKIKIKKQKKDDFLVELSDENTLLFLYRRYYYDREEYENRNGFLDWEEKYTDQKPKTNQDYIDYINAVKIHEDRFEQSLFATSNCRILNSKLMELKRTGNTGKKKASAINKYIEYIKERGTKMKVDLKYDSKLKINKSQNRIVFGAPGTGKSYRVKEDCEQLVVSNDAEYERVTFHPDYTYSQFVGTYKPYMEGGDIIYKFVPGPFMRILSKALKNILGDEKNKPFILIVEEINRANVAAVFGEVFQLLDRDKKGISEYEIEVSEDIKDYLSNELDASPDSFEKIKLPNNMFIWATMNSADQGVFPMDTAFKRRWSFEYLDINKGEEKVQERTFRINGNEYDWNKLRKAINSKLSLDLKVNEDKLLGPFFVGMDVIGEKKGNIKNKELFLDVFKNKVLMYLYEDVAKHSPGTLFSGCNNTSKYSEILKEWDNHDISIFGDDFKDKYYDK